MEICEDDILFDQFILSCNQILNNLFLGNFFNKLFIYK